MPIFFDTGASVLTTMAFISIVLKTGFLSVTPTLLIEGHDICFILQSTVLMLAGVRLTQKFRTVYSTVVTAATDARAYNYAHDSDSAYRSPVKPRSIRPASNLPAAAASGDGKAVVPATGVVNPDPKSNASEAASKTNSGGATGSGGGKAETETETESAGVIDPAVEAATKARWVDAQVEAENNDSIWLDSKKFTWQHKYLQSITQTGGFTVMNMPLTIDLIQITFLPVGIKAYSLLFVEDS